MKKLLLRRNSLLLTSFIVILLDQASKLWVRSYLTNNQSKIIVDNILKLNLVTNSGAAFSLFSESTMFLSILSLFVSVSLIIWIWNESPMIFWKGLGYSLILGGTIGNGIDRFRLGFVYDFIELIPISFPIFNVADISINIAVICLIIHITKKI